MTLRRVVIRSPNWLGDVVMAVPAVRAIRRHFGHDAHVAVASPSGIAPVYGSVAGVDEVVALPGGAASVAQLAAGRFDVAILLPNSFRSALDVYRAGIGERWGYRTDLRRLLLTRAVARPRRRAPTLRHHVHHYQELLRGLGIEPGDPTVALNVPAEAMERARTLLATAQGRRPLVGIAPGAAYGSAKRWPPEHFAAVVTRVHQTGGHAVLVGAAPDAAAGRALESSLGSAARGATTNLIGRTSLAELLAVAALCDAFVSNDSGAMHLAAAVGTRVIAIFGPTDEHATSPLGPHRIVHNDVWCRPCLLRECPIDHRCMTRIAPETIVDALLTPMPPTA